MQNKLSGTSPFIKSLIEEAERITGNTITKLRSINADMTQNRNFVVTTASGEYFLKVYSQGSVSERIFELNILQRLYEEGHTFPVQPATRETFIVEGRPVMLFHLIEGTALNPHSPVSDEHLAVIARQLAKMHTTLSTFNAGEKTRFNALGFEFVDAFKLDYSDPTIKEGLSRLRKAFRNIDTNELSTTIIHDDLSPHNVILSSTGELRFIDFDDAHRSYRISDIGTVIKEFIIGPHQAINQDKIDFFIHNYEAVENTPPLTGHEQRLLLPMILRRALFMYAYYSMVERERRIYLQSNIEYSTVSAITFID